MFRPISQLQRLAGRRSKSSFFRLQGGSNAVDRSARIAGSREQSCCNDFRNYCSTVPKSADTVTVTYVEADGSEKQVHAEIGKNLMDIAHDNNIELEGACGGELACSTCHLILEQEIYDTLPEKDEEEDDMLDLAFEVTDTSRLGCQILATKNMEGMKVKIPDDGF